MWKNNFCSCQVGKRWILRCRYYTTESKEKESVLRYCINTVRANDYESYLCTLQIPEIGRTAAFAIRAFNVELAKVKDSVSERQIGSIRLQFWKDVINEIYNGKARSHPVVLLLSKVVENHTLSKSWFRRLIEAREKSLDEKPFMSLQDVEDYGENSVSPVLYLILESLGIKDVHADHVASHIGRAIGLSTLIRAVPYNLQRQRVYLPVELLAKHRISQEDILRQKKHEKTSEVIYEIASRAHSHLETAGELKDKISKNAAKVCLPAVACKSYLQQLQKLNFNALHPDLHKRHWYLPIKIFTSSLYGVF